MEFIKEFEVRWADVDANRHMRHTAYNDYATQLRVALVMGIGVGNEAIENYEIGSVLFHEDTYFYREVVLCEKIKIDLRIRAMSHDGERWQILHLIFKENGELAAKILVEGAWIDSKRRKLAPPPIALLDKFNELPKTEDFEFLTMNSK